MVKLKIGEVVSDSIVTAGEWALRALPFAILVAGVDAASSYIEMQGFNPNLEVAAWALLIAGFVLEVVFGGVLVRAMLKGEWRGLFGLTPGRDLIFYSVSYLLYLLLIALVFLAIALPVVLACMGIMAGAGFDYETAFGDMLVFEQMFVDFLSGPAGWATLGVFLFGLLAWIAIALRGLAFGVGAIAQSRVVALEAFGWTKGNTLRLMAIWLGILIPVIVLIFVGNRLGGGIFQAMTGNTIGQLWASPSFLQAMPGLFVQALFKLAYTFLGAAMAVEVYKRIRPDEIRAEDFD